MKKVYELDFRGRKLVVEIGELAKQATGSCLVRYGDTVILSTVVVSKNEAQMQREQTITALNEAIMGSPEEAAKLITSYIKE